MSTGSAAARQLAGMDRRLPGPDFRFLGLAVDAGGRVDRLRIRSASFANWPLVPTTVPGNLVPDFPLINKSFELCYACLDR